MVEAGRERPASFESCQAHSTVRLSSEVGALPRSDSMTKTDGPMLFRCWISGFTSQEGYLRPVASMTRFLAQCVVGVCLLVAVLGAAGAHAQPDSTSAPATPALYGTWSAGVQVSPLYGASVRYNLSRRLALQAAGVPIFWEGPFRGVIGGRALYRLIAQKDFALFAAGGVRIRFDDQIQLEDPPEFEEEFTVEPTVATTVGIETNFGDHLGLSVEAGGAYEFAEDEVGEYLGMDRSGLRPVLGAGLHYYW